MNLLPRGFHSNVQSKGGKDTKGVQMDSNKNYSEERTCTIASRKQSVQVSFYYTHTHTHRVHITVE